MGSATCEPLFPSCPRGSSSTARCGSSMRQWWPFFCTSWRSWPPSAAPMKSLDSSGVPTRDAKRRGAGWLPGVADIGWSNRRGWYEGFHVLLAVNPWGMITGFGFGAASTKDQPLAEPFFALRRHPHPGLASVGTLACGPYVVDKGFEGHANHQTWGSAYGAQVLCPPKRHSRAPW